jgi:hypothetical protein
LFSSPIRKRVALKKKTKEGRCTRRNENVCYKLRTMRRVVVQEGTRMFVTNYVQCGGSLYKKERECLLQITYNAEYVPYP